MKSPLLIPAGVAALAIFLVWRHMRGWWVDARREPAPDGARSPGGLPETNRRFYDALWRHSRLVPAHRFNTWPLVESLLPTCPARLEVGPGLRPRLPVEGTEFVDASGEAVAALRRNGARAHEGSITRLPAGEANFDLVCAMDVVEHVEDDAPAFAELARVLKPGGILLLAVPLYAASWTVFDDFVGHRERYEPAELARRLATRGFQIEQTAGYGMQARWPWLAEFGIRCLLQRRAQAMWYYTHLIAPIGLHFQPRLQFRPGFLVATGVDEVLLVCRKRE